MSAQEGFAEPSGQDKGRSPLMGVPTDAMTPIRLAYLDGLRALASAYVVLFHALPGFSAQNLIGPWRLLKRTFAYGHEAVAIFIVLSGYCLMLPVVRRDPELLGVALGQFVARRAKRILPPYFAAVAFSIALLATIPSLRVRGTRTIWDDSLPGLDVGAIVSHLLVVHNWFPQYGYQINGPLWSVASEWQIYFFFPLVFLPLWRRVGMLGALLGAALLGYAPLLLAPAAARVAIPWYLLLFAFGMAAASIGFGHHELERRLRTSVPWKLVSAGLWLTCVVSSNAAATLWFSIKPVVDPLVGLSTATLLIHLTREGVSGRHSRLLALLESRALVGLGHFSYSLYLTHLPVLALCYLGLRSLGVSGPAFTLAIAVLGGLGSVALAYGFHVVVERPFMKRA
jgi:peptidoglycan/LPS O-acetylase OafA/YrhL